MRVIIAGGRDFSDYDKLRRTVTHLLSRQVEVVVVCGEARGADSLGKKLATEMGWGVQPFPADWQKNGKSAGYKRNEELLPFHKLTEEEQSVIEREFYRDNVEWLEANYLTMVWHQNPPVLFTSSIYRTISQEEQEMQHEENIEFPWHTVSSKWNALARDKNTRNWYLYNSKPLKEHVTWYGEVLVEFDETVQNVIGVDMSKWKDISWEDSLMLRPGYEQQDTVEPAVEDAISDEEALVVGSSSTKEYPVVKLKSLHKLNIGDVVRLKKTGELIEVGEYSEIGCSDCNFYTYDYSQHPCRKCGFQKNAYVDYKPPTETQDETFANTEMKEYADLDSKTKEFLSTKRKEG